MGVPSDRPNRFGTFGAFPWNKDWEASTSFAGGRFSYCGVGSRTFSGLRPSTTCGLPAFDASILPEWPTDIFTVDREGCALADRHQTSCWSHHYSCGHRPTGFQQNGVGSRTLTGLGDSTNYHSAQTTYQDQAEPHCGVSSRCTLTGFGSCLINEFFTIRGGSLYQFLTGHFISPFIDLQFDERTTVCTWILQPTSSGGVFPLCNGTQGSNRVAFSLHNWFASDIDCLHCTSVIRPHCGVSSQQLPGLGPDYEPDLLRYCITEADLFIGKEFPQIVHQISPLWHDRKQLQPLAAIRPHCGVSSRSLTGLGLDCCWGYDSFWGDFSLLQSIALEVRQIQFHSFNILGWCDYWCNTTVIEITEVRETFVLAAGVWIFQLSFRSLNLNLNWLASAVFAWSLIPSQIDLVPALFTHRNQHLLEDILLFDILTTAALFVGKELVFQLNCTRFSILLAVLLYVRLLLYLIFHLKRSLRRLPCWPWTPVLRTYQPCERLVSPTARGILCGKPGPKSGHTWLKRLSCIRTIQLLHIVFMIHLAGYGGEGSGSVMGVTGVSYPNHRIGCFPSDTKQHDERPPARSVCQSHSLTKVTKRSLKRAQKRAATHGIAWYRGRLYRPADFHFMPPLLDHETAPVPPHATQAHATARCNQHHGTKSKVTCFQWNVGGLSNHRLDELKAWLSLQNIQVVTLLETRWQFTGEWLDPDWIHIHSGSPGDKGKGILTMISRQFCNERDLRWQEIDNGRLIHLRVPTKSRPLDLLCGYQHVDKRGPTCLQKRETWWANLDRTLQCLPHRNLLLIMADFNTNALQSKSHSGSEWYWWNNQLTRGSQHQDAGRFSALLRFHGLTTLNTWSARDGPTYINGAQSSRIDYACARLSQTDGQAKRPRYMWNAPFMSSHKHGHVPMIHQIPLHWIRAGHPKVGGISRQQYQQAHAAFQEHEDRWYEFLQHGATVMTEELQKVWSSGCASPSDLSSLHDAVNHCFQAHFPPTRPPKKVTPWTRSVNVILTKWQHRERLLNIKTCTGAGVFRAWFHLTRFAILKRQHRRHSAQIRRNLFQSIVQSAQEAAQKHDMHRMYSLINRYAPKSTRRRPQIRNSHGAIASPQEELLILKNFVEDIWGGPRSIPVSLSQAPGIPFTLPELTEALRGIPLHRAVAHPFAPGLVWRSQSHVIAPILFQILGQWWSVNPPYIPQIWKDGWMLMLGKPNKPATTPYNLRPIALQDPVGKAIIGLLIRHACADAKPLMLPWPIWAYLPTRSTLDAICRVASHCKMVALLVASQKPTPHARALGVPKYCFCGGVSVMLDLERAFDNVSREKLFCQLHKLQIRPEITHLLTHWHTNTQYHFQHGSDTVALPTGAGLRQGCKAAPGLWNCLMVLYLQQAAQKIPITWLRQHLNIYADDYQVGGGFYTVSDLRLLLHAFGILLETLQMFSLKTNPKKSAALLAIAGTSHRHQRAQFVVTKNNCEQLRIPLPEGGEVHIPIHSKVTYLGTQMTYKDCATATLQHRMCLAKVAQRRLGRWLRGKHDFSIASRFQLWRSTVYPVLTHGIFSTSITTQGICTLQKELCKMLRQVACDHAYRTGHTNNQAISNAGFPTPLQLLRATAEQLLRSITQRLTRLPEDDITLQLPWDHLTELVTTLHDTQDLYPLLVEPAVPRTAPRGFDLLHCDQCDFITPDVSTLRRHCTIAHGIKIVRKHFVDASHFTSTGLPECKYCGSRFTTWRNFQVHIERGCQVLYAGPCAIEPSTQTGAQAYMTGTALAAGELLARSSTMLPESELTILRQASFGTELSRIIDQREWDKLARLPDACQYLAKRCILCGLHYNRVQELNAHYRTMHGQYWEGVPQRAVYMSNTWATDRPCPFCGALFRTHLCPVWVQVTALLLYGVGVPPGITEDAEAPTPRLRCEVCLTQFDDLPALTEHMQTAHALQGVLFNIARDSIAGDPACAHCGMLYDSMASLRSHINQARCLEFRPDATSETKPMNAEWQQACLEGTMKILLTNPQFKMALTLHCQLCGVRYQRSTDLSGHLQGSHSRLWRGSQQLTLILVSLYYAKGTCVCNPALHQNRLDHVCLPLRQLAMLYQKMDKIFSPHQVTDHVLQMLMSRELPAPTRQLMEQLATQHCHDRLLQDAQILEVLRTQCLLCGRARDASALTQHLREAHPCNHLALSFYMSQLVPMMIAWQKVDYQCYACLQYFNMPTAADVDAVPDPHRQLLVQSHLLYNCPCLLQVALFLTGLLHDGQLNDESCGAAGATAGAGDVQGPCTIVQHDSAVPQSKRAKTQQASARRSSSARPSEPRGSPTTAAAAPGHSGSAARPAGTSTRQRSQPEPQSRQLCSFFQPRPAGRLTGAVEGHDPMAGAAEVIDHSDDDLAPTLDATSVPGSHGESAEDLRDQTGGRAVQDVGPAQFDRCERQLAFSGMGSEGQAAPNQQQSAHQHDPDDSACQGAGRDVQESRSGAVLQVTSGLTGSADLPMETPTLSTCGQGMGTSDQTEPMQRLDPPGNDAQAACSSPVRVGGCDSAEHGSPDAQRGWQRQTQADPTPEGISVSPPLTMLLHVLSHLCLRNDSNWCYANSTIMSLLWTLMSMQCDAFSLGMHFAELIQFLPCHNLQSVALIDLSWFNQILQNWEAVVGDQRGRQQDAAEFATALLTWLRAPAVNMTWERRVDENDVVHAHDRGDAYMPINVFFPETHAHMPDSQFTLTSLIRNWMQVDGMVAALLQAPQCICVHLDRFFEVENEIQKSQCAIDMEAGCDIPVFTDSSLRREYVGYVIVGATAHLGSVNGGHFQAVMKARPTVQRDGSPMHWLLTNDDSEAQPVWMVPDWFRCNTNMFWLLRADCVQLHTYQVLPQNDAAPTTPTACDTLESRPMTQDTIQTDAASSAPPSAGMLRPQMNQQQDATTAAIMAMLQVTSMAERQR